MANDEWGRENGEWRTTKFERGTAGLLPEKGTNSQVTFEERLTGWVYILLRTAPKVDMDTAEIVYGANPN